MLHFKTDFVTKRGSHLSSSESQRDKRSNIANFFAKRIKRRCSNKTHRYLFPLPIAIRTVDHKMNKFPKLKPLFDFFVLIFLGPMWIGIIRANFRAPVSFMPDCNDTPFPISERVLNHAFHFLSLGAFAINSTWRMAAHCVS